MQIGFQYATPLDLAAICVSGIADRSTPEAHLLLTIRWNPRRTWYRAMVGEHLDLRPPVVFVRP